MPLFADWWYLLSSARFHCDEAAEGYAATWVAALVHLDLERWQSAGATSLHKQSLSVLLEPAVDGLHRILEHIVQVKLPEGLAHLMLMHMWTCNDAASLGGKQHRPQDPGLLTFATNETSLPM
jgi:hypothetical protein